MCLHAPPTPPRVAVSTPRRIIGRAAMFFNLQYRWTYQVLKLVARRRPRERELSVVHVGCDVGEERSAQVALTLETARRHDGTRSGWCDGRCGGRCGGWWWCGGAVGWCVGGAEGGHIIAIQTCVQLAYGVVTRQRRVLRRSQHGYGREYYRNPVKLLKANSDRPCCSWRVS